MRESKHEKAASERSKSTKYAGGTQVVERRQSVRFQFTASAQVVDRLTGARFSTRTTDLGPGGCFVDTMLPFPVGAKVRVSVRKGQSNLETGGVVVYSQMGLGMGIAFDTMEPRQREALDTWLTELTGTRHSAAASGSYEVKDPSAVPGPEAFATVTRLVRLLITKGILTEAEGSSVLYDPVL